MSLSINDVKVGDVFGNWTIVEILPKTVNCNRHFICKCVCGEIKEIDAYNVLSGKSTSCGCVRDLETKKRMTKHGQKRTRLYNIWCGMKERCNNPNSQAYKDYGSRDITICDEWNNDFMNFYQWSIENGYEENLSIDRIDVNGNYEPSNCRWATTDEQCNNRRNNIKITYNGKTQTLFQWCEEYGLEYRMILARYHNPNFQNKSIEELLFTPNQKQILITYKNETHTISEWSKLTNIRHNVIFDRWQKGYYEEDILYKGSVPKKYGGFKYIPRKQNIERK